MKANFSFLKFETKKTVKENMQKESEIFNAVMSGWDEKDNPEKIANLFSERKSITPYQFAELDFDNKALVYKNRYLARNDEIEK